jgi:hypothetical protein
LMTDPSKTSMRIRRGTRRGRRRVARRELDRSCRSPRWWDRWPAPAGRCRTSPSSGVVAATRGAQQVVRSVRVRSRVSARRSRSVDGGAHHPRTARPTDRASSHRS